MIENIKFADRHDITNLPDNMVIRTYVDLTRCTNLQKLPDNLWVGWDLYLNYCIGLHELPEDLYVADSIYVYGCQQRLIDECEERGFKVITTKYNIFHK